MNRQISMPGLVDMHVHLREPGQNNAETFASGTEAALAGGVIAVMDMPNNTVPIRTPKQLAHKISLARPSARAAIGFYFGAAPNGEMIPGTELYQQQLDRFRAVGSMAFGLKIYCDVTTGSNEKRGTEDFRGVASAWLTANPEKVIIAHTEGAAAIAGIIGLVAGELGGRIHIPHISKRHELETVISAKQNPKTAHLVTGGVCPHHLFLSQNDVPRLGWYGMMKPTPGTPEDVQFLREHISEVDIIETDHAPHPRAAKDRAQAENPGMDVSGRKPTCFGVPGLEAMLPLLLHGTREGWITQEQIDEKVRRRPAALLGLSLPESEVVVELGDFTFQQSDVHSACGWSPYVGMPAGRIKHVFVDGAQKVKDGRVIAPPGSAPILTP